jgi:hypothetical protein
MYLWVVCFNMSGKDVRVGWMEVLQVVQPLGGASAWDKNMAVTPQLTQANWATLGSRSAGVFRRHMQQLLVRPWWAHPIAREFPGLDASRLFRVGIRQATCVWTETTEWSWPPTENYRGLCTDHSGNAARQVAQLVRAVWTVPRPPWRSCWVLMCWNKKVVPLLHMYIPLTGNKVDSFLQRFRFFSWRLKRITLYYDIFS